MLKILGLCSHGLAILLLAACAARTAPPQGVLAHLPRPVTNAAAARIGDTVYAFAGLHAGKTWRDVTASAAACNLAQGTCRALPPLPDGLGRLAASAVAVDGKVYVFGGYSVAEDGTEHSTPQVWVFDPQSETYTRAPDMPVPVDDSAAFVFAGRYVLLVSGWHEHNNVALVQVLDTRTGRWFRSTDFPGAPVFGHAGALSGQRLLICGGVKVMPAPRPGGKRRFVLSKACWQGRVSQDARTIQWALLGDAAPGAAYRRAAAALPDGRMVFYGGTLTPYNYNGIGYDGTPAAPLARLDIARTDRKGRISWRRLAAPPGMDYRAGLVWRGALITLGGMGPAQTVLDRVQAIALPAPQH